MQGVVNIYQAGVASGVAVVTLIEVETPASVSPMAVVRAWIENETSEVSEQWTCSIVRKSVDGTNVTAPTAALTDLASSAHGLTLRGMCTTVGTISETIFRRGFNVLNGWEWVATPEDQIILPANAAVIGLHLPVAPPSSITISCGLTLLRLG